MHEFLRQYFQPGTYDILRKNCNSFTDCALYYLMGCRLAWSFRAAERVGLVADESVGIVQAISGGSYVPNHQAAKFNLDAIFTAIRIDLGYEDSDEGDSEGDGGDADDDCSTAGSDEE